MKINETGRIGAVNPYHRNPGQHETKAVRKNKLDNVQISKEALEMQMNVNRSQQERAQQVADLKQQVQTGTYFVDAKKIAEKLFPFIK
ncbi:flagellar biosynthesis anti-sigma factor FlgM [Paenibacillus sp. GCM10023250]|uniref:flagellar biosynthesis anti-sigma factor FlgM n=1 Tax=Paenibacillus sp. GCM10023250 TaxID=3252648 RepID=UPI00361E55AF